jgi:hypothetical protein
MKAAVIGKAFDLNGKVPGPAAPSMQADKNVWSLPHIHHCRRFEQGIHGFIPFAYHVDVA